VAVLVDIYADSVYAEFVLEKERCPVKYRELEKFLGKL